MKCTVYPALVEASKKLNCFFFLSFFWLSFKSFYKLDSEIFSPIHKQLSKGVGVMYLNKTNSCVFFEIFL